MSKKDSNKQFLEKTSKYKKFFLKFILALDKFEIPVMFFRTANRFAKLIGFNRDIRWIFRYRDIIKLFNNNPFKSAKSKKTVVFFQFFPTSGSFTLFNLLLAKYFEKRNFTPVMAVCNSVLHSCTIERVGKTKENTPLICSECILGVDQIASKLMLEVDKLNIYQDAECEEIIRNFKSEIINIDSIEELEAVKHAGIEIGSIVYKSVLRFFYAGRLSTDDKIIEQFKKYLIAACQVHTLANKYLKNFDKGSKVILQNGTLFVEKIIAEVCNNQSIDFLTYETFIGDNTVIYAKNREVMDLNWGKSWSTITLSEEVISKVDQFLSDLKVGKGLYARLNDEVTDDKFQSENIAVLFTNLNFDTAVLGKNTIFTDMINWIEETIKFWQDNIHSHKLVIRIHPGELKLVTPSSEFIGDIIGKYESPNVIILPPEAEVNSYNLIDGMKFGLVYTSTIGIECAYLGKPVIVAGDAFYKDNDFVSTPKSKEEYFRNIMSLVAGEIVQINKENLIKFIYSIYFIHTKRLKNIRMVAPNGEDIILDYNLDKLLSENEEVLEDIYSLLVEQN